MSIAILALLSTFSAHPGFAAAGIIRVGYYDHPPLVWSDGSSMRGLFVELLEEMAVKENWTINYDEVTIDSGMARIEDGRLDLLVPFQKGQHDPDWIRTNDETIISTWARIFAGKNLKVSSILDLKGRSIGVVGESIFNGELRDISEGFDLKCTIVELKTTSDILGAVEKGWVDLGAVDNIRALRETMDNTGAIKTSVMFAPSELKFSAHASRLGLLQVIDYHIAELKKDQGSLYYVALNKVYFDVSDPNSFQIMQWILISAGGLILLAGGIILIMRYRIKKTTDEITTKTKELSAEKIKLEWTEEALSTSSEILEETFSSLMDGILLASGSSMRIVKCNASAAACFGCTQNDLLGLTPADLLSDSEGSRINLAVVWEDVKTTGHYFGNMDLQRRNGSVFPVELAVTAIYDDKNQMKLFVIIVRDISERVRAEETLRQNEKRGRQSQKMEALGTLAGGIAHDFNNILTPIIGYADLISRKIESNDLLLSHVEQIVKASERAKSLIGQIMTFSRQTDLERKHLRVGPLVKEGMKLLRAGIPANIELKYKSSIANDWVLADPTEIHQVLMNICTNATYAMKDKGGVLEVTLHNFDGNVKGYCVDPPVENTTYLRLSISDTGIGIAPEIFDRIFDPFFTTKAPGEGTVIGLAVVHGIIRGCKGKLSVESYEGKGTTFHLFFPISEPSKEVVPVSNRAKTVGRGERVMVIDDEEMIRKLAEDFLHHSNFKVQVFSDGAAGLAYFEENRDVVDIVITDQSMPKLTGMELSARLLAIKPDLPIILCTGYMDNANHETVKASGISELVRNRIRLKSYLSSSDHFLTQDCSSEEMGIMRKSSNRNSQS